MKAEPLCIAVLDTMWIGKVQRAPRFFTISPHNLTGRRLYSLTQGYRLRVTNVCRYTVRKANEHGTPDPAWLLSNLLIAGEIDLLLVCGTRALKTFEALAPWEGLKVGYAMRIPHPAWRAWTTEMLEQLREEIMEIRNKEVSC